MLLSRTYPPSPALAPYIRRHYVFEANLPDDFEIVDALLTETAFVRILLRGDWAAEVSNGQWQGAGQTLLFGSNAKPFKVRVRGPFTVVGFAIRPSGWSSLFTEPAHRCTDRMEPLCNFWGEQADQLLADVSDAPDDEAKIRVLEAAIERQIDCISVSQTDKAIAAFEKIVRVDSMVKVDDVARHIGMSVRHLERRCLATFGMTPKMILRRSRFLDMAAAMRGFSSPTEEHLAALRYFDQSHLNREFRRFAAMTPRSFAHATTPLFTASLKLREEGKAID